MINRECNYVCAATIDSAWRETMWLCVSDGYDFLVRGGSYVGQIRKQLDGIQVRITNPWIRPLAPILPPGIPSPTSDDKICAYFLRYIIGGELADNEVYTYGQFITLQLEHIINLLNNSNGNTNQACITIGDALTTQLDDPPCLRTISFKVVDGRLNMSVFFRSWDLYAGFPENLGGLQMLKEYVLGMLNFPVTDGQIIAYSDGLHLYDQYFQIVDTLNVEKVNVGLRALKDKEEYILTNGE